METDYVDPYDAFMDAATGAVRNGELKPFGRQQLRVVQKNQKREWVSGKILRAFLLMVIWMIGAVFVVYSKVMEFLSKATFYIGKSLMNYTGRSKEI